jgi:phenylpropionate dioxygenase-like ring-hydroxylating dioxygenase large terminal subunit
MLEGFADEGFSDVWTPVALSREVGKAPYALTLASERLVLFRDKEGRVAALHDQCPHRGVKLSLGKVGKDGCLECPFHGWRFASSGACKDIPLNPMPEEKRQRYAATAFPVRERGGLIWVYTRPGAEAPDEPQVPADLEDARFSTFFHAETWRAHWTRAMENMLDMPHLPFVHRRTIGGGLRRQLRPDSSMEVQVQPTPTGFRLTSTLDGVPNSGFLDWNRPNNMTLTILDTPRRTLRMRIWCVPVDANHTRMMMTSSRNFMRYNPLALLFNHFNRVIMKEDRPVVESSHPVEVPAAAEERSVATDRATLAFRRWYLERKGVTQSSRSETSRVEGRASRLEVG